MSTTRFKYSPTHTTQCTCTHSVAWTCESQLHCTLHIFAWSDASECQHCWVSNQWHVCVDAWAETIRNWICCHQLCDLTRMSAVINTHCMSANPQPRDQASARHPWSAAQPLWIRRRSASHQDPRLVVALHQMCISARASLLWWVPEKHGCLTSTWEF